MDSLIGKTLKNRYKVEESLGRGGMADVYKVWDEERSTYLALKLLRDDLAQDPVFMRRFRREAHNLAQLQHPNIVRFYGLEEDDLKAFILMEYIEGPTLREEIRRAGSGGLALERVQSIMEGVCSALQYAHNKGLVHCDIKSGNILIDASRKAYLTDFGIARGMDMATSTMVGVGTPAYMAPELIKGEDPTPQTDIYALGIVLYEMLTGGERPFTGERAEITGTTAEKVRWEHLNVEATPLSHYIKNSHKGLQILMNRCLAKDPKARFPTVIELFIELYKQGNASESCVENKKPEQEYPVEKFYGEINFGRPHRQRNKAWIIFSVVVIGLLVCIPTFIRSEQAHVTQTAIVREVSTVISPTTDVGATLTAQVQAVDTIATVTLLAQEEQLCQIAFTSSHDIYTMNGRGEKIKQITYDRYFEGDLDWSTNGSKIIYLRDDNKIQTIDVYGQNVQGIDVDYLDTDVSPMNYYYQPAWSPNGLFIAYSHGIWNNGGIKEESIVVFNIENGDIKKLSLDEVLSNTPSWSPDSSQIAYASYPYYEYEKSEIFLMNADGTNVRQLTNNECYDGTPSWSSDGSKIAYTSDCDGDYDIYVMNIDGSNINKLTNNNCLDTDPDWSPHGIRIVFSSDCDGDAEIFSIDADGENLTQLTFNEINDLDPVWSPVCR